MGPDGSPDSSQIKLANQFVRARCRYTYISLQRKAAVTFIFVSTENWMFQTVLATGMTRMNSKMDSMVVRVTHRAT
jgi:hypothetical protein